VHGAWEMRYVEGHVHVRGRMVCAAGMVSHMAQGSPFRHSCAIPKLTGHPWYRRRVLASLRPCPAAHKSCLKQGSAHCAVWHGTLLLRGRYDLDCSHFLLLSTAGSGNTSELGAEVETDCYRRTLLFPEPA
jgi:hypothetical protein